MRKMVEVKKTVKMDVFNEHYALNCVEDFGKINISELRSKDIMKYHFPVGYLFYNWHASLHGFGARKSKIAWNCNGEAIQQTFLCHREGYRAQKQCSERKRSANRNKTFVVVVKQDVRFMLNKDAVIGT